VEEAREERAGSPTPSLFDRVSAAFRRERMEWRAERTPTAAEEESATENAGGPEGKVKSGH
jgi:hypothetical protein